MATMPQLQRQVTVGVDSHKDVHVAAAVDQVGRILATTQAPTTLRGYAQLERWLTGRGWQVVEVNRPNRQLRRRRGKSDPVDAEAAAQAALAGDDTTTPKAATGAVELLRALRVARRSAVKARSQAANQLDSLVVTAPDQLRAQLRRLPAAQLVEVAATLRPGELHSPLAAVKLALRELARRHQALSAEIDRLDAHIAKLTNTTRLWAAGTPRCRRPGRDRAAGRRRRQPHAAAQ